MVNPDLRFVYTTRLNQKGQVLFLVDAESNTSVDFSPPGELYPDASVAFKNVFVSAQPIVEGPSKDNYGIWFSGLAPVIDESTNKVIAVVGIDESAMSVFESAAAYSSIPILIVILIIVLLVMQQRRVDRVTETLSQKAQFVTIASHDIRSPLNGLVWAFEALNGMLGKTKDKDKEVAEMIDTMSSGCQQIIDTVSSVLDTMQMENDGASNQLIMAPADVTKLAKNAVALHKLNAKTRDIKIVFEGKWPAQYIQSVDAGSLGRAIANVIGNAVKYTHPKTTVRVGFGVESGSWHISVTDQGDGIPQADLDKIGERFFRGKAAGGKIIGTGLGMFFTKQIIEKHNGVLELKSTGGVGTTATIRIPTATPTSAPNYSTAPTAPNAPK
jgi:signal transduction histidine kinase